PPRPTRFPCTTLFRSLAAQDLTEAQRRQAGLPEDEGVRITAVDGEAARSAGIRPGDVITRVGRSVVGSAADLDRLLRGVRPGQTDRKSTRLNSSHVKI